MMERTVTDWLIDNLPRESAPVITWMAGNFDAARPLLLLLFASVLLLEIAVAYGVWRYMTR